MRTLLPVALLLSSTLSTAGADKVGAFLLGAQYERDLSDLDSVRFGLGLPIALASGDSGLLILSGDVSYLKHTAPAGSGVQPYYGAGLGLFTLLASSGGSGGALVGVYPNVLGGANFAVTQRIDAFVEGSAGPRVFLASAGGSSGTSVELGFGVRLGFNYRLP